MRAASLLVFLALAGSATAAVLGSGAPSGARASAVGTEGSFSFDNSRDGLPIFSATGIGPGDSASGTVEIANSGSVPGELVLGERDITDTPSLGGGKLSAQLVLRVTDVTAPGAPAIVYSGPLAPMPAQQAGRIEAGESRRYEFVVTLPDAGGGSQNDLQGASTSVAYSWTASEVSASPKPAPPAEPSPGSAGAGSLTGPAYVPPAAWPLALTITRVQRAIRHGRLLVWARCDTPCAIAARGRLSARGSTGHRGAKLRLSRWPRFKTGPQRLPIRIPRRLRAWLRTHPDRLRLRARLILFARSPAGAQATARRALRVRSASRSATVRGSSLER